ncbi:MAG TPA: hypothetical protein DCE41_00115 [Cytophagales bacterium]|nr:hypothetical protein [Cytophagales bacterium]HAA18833.1 hypothetical protein [Cytophagales bacterium]HAP60890.1 hypothetical protein [Cytophagales bacterium]
MRIVIQTKVEQTVDQVKAGFNEKLFMKLSPPFPPVKLLRFDGSRTGDVVSLELNFLLLKQKWTSHITEDETKEGLFRFVDEGKSLPFFLKYWRHHHQILQDGSGSMIVDDISFQAPLRLLTPLLYPVLFLQFWYRKPIYRSFFKA